MVWWGIGCMKIGKDLMWGIFALLPYSVFCWYWGVNVFEFKSEAWVQYDSPIIAVLAVSIFGLFITRKWKNIRFLWTVDRLCFGAYLIHPLFIQFTYRFLKVTPINFSLYLIVTVLLALFFIGLSFAAPWIMRKKWIFKKTCFIRHSWKEIVCLII